MTFQENNYKKTKYLKIKKLYFDNKFKNLIKEAEKYLEFYPEDVKIRFMYAKALRHEKKYEEAIENLKLNLEKEPNDEHSIMALFFLHYYLYMYKEAYEMVPQLFEIDFSRKSISILKLIIEKNLGYCSYLRETEKDNYLKNQIVNFNRELAYEHILDHTIDDEFNENEKGIFNDVDIKYLMSSIEKNIPNAERINSQEVMDIYYFGISNIGYSGSELCNYVKAVVVPNTTNIISLYPTVDIKESTFQSLMCDYDKLFKRNNKVKTMSRIDKFNKKYNM